MTNAAEPPDPPRSLLRQVVPRPTGQNGYEEFLAAADIVSSPRVREALAAWDVHRADLSHARQVAQLAQPAFALVRQGLRKPVFEPRGQLDFTMRFPELPGFRALARAYSAEVWVRFADGEPRLAVRAAVEGLRFSRAISCSLLIHDLVSLACKAILFAELESHIAHIPEPDAALLTSLVDELLAGEPLWLAVASREAELAMRMLTGFMETPEDPAFEWMLDPEFGVLPPEAEALPRAAPARKAAVQRDFAAHLGFVLAQLRERASKPEAEWLVPPGTFGASEPVTQFFAGSFEVFHALPASQARVRTQLRLLRLHAGITQFRWQHRRLPRDLAELGQPAWLEDPLSGEPFQYRIIAGLTYELYSKGAGDIGRVDLRYVRPRPPEDEEPGHP